MERNVNMDKTTELESVRQDPTTFHWGNIVNIYEIGPYGFVKYNRQDGVFFHVYVCEVSTNTSCKTLDEAMIFAIARRNLEVNEAHWMTEAAKKVLLRKA